METDVNIRLAERMQCQFLLAHFGFGTDVALAQLLLLGLQAFAHPRVICRGRSQSGLQLADDGIVLFNVGTASGVLFFLLALQFFDTFVLLLPASAQVEQVNSTTSYDEHTSKQVDQYQGVLLGVFQFQLVVLPLA